METGACGVCAATEAPYRCPRCATPYCGTTCYRRHGGGSCTEAFYKDQVEGELRRRAAEQKRTLELEPKRDAQRVKTVSDDQVRQRQALERSLVGGDKTAPSSLALENDGDDGEVDALAERLKRALGVAEISTEDIEGASLEILESAMTEDDRARFTKQITAARLSLAPDASAPRPYVPWWSFPLVDYVSARQTRVARRLVWDMADAGKDHGQQETNDDAHFAAQGTPRIWFSDEQTQAQRASIFARSRGETLASIGAPATVSDSFKYHVCSVILAYAHVLRLFNGRIDPENDQDVLRELATRSSILRGEPFAPEVIEQVLLDSFGSSSVGSETAAGLGPRWPRRAQGAMAQLSIESPGEDELGAELFASHEQQLVDARALCEHPSEFLADALLDLWWCFRNSPTRSRRVKFVERKLWFMVVWAQTEGSRCMGCFALDQAAEGFVT